MKQPRTHGAKLRGGTDAEETSIVSHEEERQNRLLHDVYNSQKYGGKYDVGETKAKFYAELKQEGLVQNEAKFEEMIQAMLNGEFYTLDGNSAESHLDMECCIETGDWSNPVSDF